MANENRKISKCTELHRRQLANCTQLDNAQHQVMAGIFILLTVRSHRRTHTRTPSDVTRTCDYQPGH